MKFTHYISAFVLALLLVPGAVFVAQAETNSSSDATLEELVEKLTDRVEALEKDLKKAESRIAELEKKTGTTVKVKAKWDGDKYQKGDKKVCHAGQTLEVSGWAAAAHVIHHPGDFLGECNEGEDDNGKDDDDKDDDKDDDDEDDDD